MKTIILIMIGYDWFLHFRSLIYGIVKNKKRVKWMYNSKFKYIHWRTWFKMIKQPKRKFDLINEIGWCIFWGIVFLGVLLFMENKII